MLCSFFPSNVLCVEFFLRAAFLPIQIELFHFVNNISVCVFNTLKQNIPEREKSEIRNRSEREARDRKRESEKNHSGEKQKRFDDVNGLMDIPFFFSCFMCFFVCFCLFGFCIHHSRMQNLFGQCTLYSTHVCVCSPI